MSDRYLHLTVILNEPHDRESLEPITAAIKLLPGVADAVPHLRDFPNDVIAKAQVRQELASKILDLFEDITSTG